MKNQLRIYAIIFLLFFSGCAYYNTFFNAKKFFKEAETERKKNQEQSTSNAAKQKYTKAIEKASRLLEFYPNSKYVDDALFLLGQSFFYKEEYRQAKRKFEELITNFPKSEYVPESRLWLGKTNTELRDYKTAEKNFQDILAGKAKQEIHDEAQFLMGGLHFHKEDYVIALQEYKVSAQNAKDKNMRSQSYYQMGECYLLLKDFAAAATCFEKARKYSRNATTEFEALFKAGLATKDLEQYDKAIDIFTELIGDINNEDNWPECKFQIAECLYFKGEVANAISWYESIIEDHKRSEAAAKAYFNLGLIYQKEKSDYEQAKEYFDLASKENAKAEIVPQAKANFNAIKNLLALKEDIKEQEKRIAAGDSIAAAMDSLEVDTSSVEIEEEEKLAQTPDSSITNQDSTNNVVDFFPESKKQENNSAKKLALKSGELGTPKEELIKDKLMLAEIYLLDFNQPDSALFEYMDIMQRDTTEANLSKVIYSIGFIFDKYKGEKTVADSIYEKLITAYPNSVYADKARDFLKLPKADKSEEIAQQQFKKAEATYMERNNYNFALTQFGQIAANYPQSRFAPKSLYTMGWIYETELHDNPKALEIYQKLVDAYPETAHAKRVKKKIDEVNKEKNKTEEEKKKEAELARAEEQPETDAETELLTLENTDLTKMDKNQYRELLRREMTKDNRRMRNPKRIIK